MVWMASDDARRGDASRRHPERGLLSFFRRGSRTKNHAVLAMASHSTVLRERPCPLLVSHAPTDIPAIPHLKKALEDANLSVKIDALKKVILLMLSGEPATQLIMPIIRFVLPSKDRTIKKLLMLYWEVVDKKAADGKLLHEMILVWYAVSSTHFFCLSFSFNFSIFFDTNPSYQGTL